jgi:hypothetical protein
MSIPIICVRHLLFICPYTYLNVPLFTHSRKHVKIQILASYQSSFYPHSKTLFISIEVCCSYYASEPSAPNLSNPLDNPFASHTYFYFVPNYNHFYPFLPWAVTLSNYHGSNPIIKLFSLYCL